MRTQLASILDEYDELPETSTRRIRREHPEIEIQKTACTEKYDPAISARSTQAITTSMPQCSPARCNLYKCAPRYMYWVESVVDVRYIKLVAAINAARTKMQLMATLTAAKTYTKLVSQYTKLYGDMLRPTVTPHEWRKYLQ